MTREEFIAQYMGDKTYTVNRERVFWGGGYTVALPCKCGEPDCLGWAMMPPHLEGWHRYMNDPEEDAPTYEQAMAIDGAFHP